MRALLIVLVFHENVEEFGDVEVRRMLGELYIIHRLVLCPTELGWPSARRRQILVLVLKTFIFPVLLDMGLSATTQVAIDTLKLQSNLRKLFFRLRGPAATWHMYLIADEAEMQAENRWSMRRPGVRER